MQTDFLLSKFFEKERWLQAIETGVVKDIAPDILRSLCSPDTRLAVYNAIENGEYQIAPPHEAQIPKDDGSMRTVYVNDDQDRILLSICNDMLFELCPDMIHPNCVSYQKGIGCGKIVQKASDRICRMTSHEIGVKVDLSKYFDSVPIRFIDQIFDNIEIKYGKSALIHMLRQYYHDNTVIDMKKQRIQKYSSLRQGCAVAAFLADSVLYNIDEEISAMDVFYVRYSDDILILGNDWKHGYEILKQRLQEKELILNPKKAELLYNDRWFKFLGFTINHHQISLGKSRIKTFQQEIEKRTILSGDHDIHTVMQNVYQYLYHGTDNYSWATNVLPVINVDQDINTLNTFVMDAIRAAVTTKTRIGGLGVTANKPNQTVFRGKGRHVRHNREQIAVIPDYKTIKCMQNALMTSHEAYLTLINTL